jgi:hypothetical protein
MYSNLKLKTQLVAQNPFKKSSFNLIVQRFLILLLLLSSVNLSIAQQKTLGVTKYRSGSTKDGYVLFAPMASTTTYLINKCGEKVHQWKSNYLPGVSVYLLPDGHLLRTGVLLDTNYNVPGRGGIIEKIDWNGNVVWSYKLLNDSLAQHHDIEPLDNGNILVIAYHGIPANKAYANGRASGTVDATKLFSERILEIKPKGTNDADIVWQWTLWDHIIQDVDLGKPDYNVIGSHPELMNVNYFITTGSDWIHLNSIQYNKDLDQIVLSCHNTSEIWIIDHSTTTAEAASHSGGNSGKGGDILYRWGNPEAYNKGTSSAQKLFKQHDARWIKKGYKDGGDIMIFNNGLGRTPAYSSVEIITPPTSAPGVYQQTLPYGPSNQKWTYKDSTPTKFYSMFISGADQLPNGNVLICSGNQGRFFEVGKNNTIVWEYINPVSASDNYLTDGEKGVSNEVFRCVYYSDTFAAFKGKSLTPQGTLEKNSYSYSCTPVPPDTKAPKTLVFIPADNEKDVTINSTLDMYFDEPVKKGTGNIRVYENNILKETINVSDAKVKLTSKFATFTAASNFANGARIAIAMDKGIFKDTADNDIALLDSTNWAFFTVKKAGIYSTKLSSYKPIYPNPSQKQLYISFENEEPKVEIINAIGQSVSFLISNKSNRELTLDIGELPKGIYSVLFNGQFVQRIVKN